MKTAEELKAIKEEVKNLNGKLAELTDEELKQVTGGMKIMVIKTPLEPENMSEANRFIPIP